MASMEDRGRVEERDLESGNVNVDDVESSQEDSSSVTATEKHLSPPTLLQADTSSARTSTSDPSDSSSSTQDVKEKAMEAPLTITHPLPPNPKHHWLIGHLRHLTFTVYRRLFICVLIPNILGFVLLTPALLPYNFDRYLEIIAGCASANLFLAVSIRQDYIVNFLCEAVIFVTPKNSPLRVRRVMAKVYEFGGIHSGAAVCAVGWFIRLAVLLTRAFETHALRDISTLVMLYILLLLFVGIIVFSYPTLRRKMHNTFERTHRFAGWLASALFWALIIISANAMAAREEDLRTLGQVLVSLPSFWLLSINTIHSFLPWLRLRRLPALAEPLSPHALRLHLKANVGPFYTIRISDTPLTEWHSFAIFLDKPSADAAPSAFLQNHPNQALASQMTNSLVISKAGDWTSKHIADPNPHYWTRGLPTRGVLYMSLLFRRIVLITTGSGIGPCLNLLSMPREERPEVRVLWSTPAPVETFGEEIVDSVKEADPGAVVWDTKRFGRPDLVGLAWELVQREQAEACFVISNPKVTRKVVYALESRGVAAYAPIFDS